MKKRLLAITLVAGALAFAGCAKDEASLSKGIKTDKVYNYAIKYDYKQIDIAFDNSINLILGSKIITEKTEYIPGIGYGNLSQSLQFEKVGNKINIHEVVYVTNLFETSSKSNIKLFSQIRSLDSKNCSSGGNGYFDESVQAVTLDVERMLGSKSEMTKTKDFKRGYESRVDVCVDDSKPAEKEEVLQVRTQFKYFEPVLLHGLYK